MSQNFQSIRSPLILKKNLQIRTKPSLQTTRSEVQSDVHSNLKKSGWFKYLHFSFDLNIIRRAKTLARAKQHLTSQDFNALGSSETAEGFEQSLYYYLERQRNSKVNKLSLFKAIYMAFRSRIRTIITLELVYKLLRVFIVWIFSEFLKTSARSSQEKYIWAGALAAVYLIALYLEQHWTFQANLLSCRTKFGLMSLVYSKLLKVSLWSVHKSPLEQTTRSIMSEMSIFDSSSMFFGSVFAIAPLIICATLLLWFFFGPSALLGIAYLIISFPLQSFIRDLGNKYRTQRDGITQERLEATRELIKEIGILKMYTWELIFKESVNHIRTKETQILKRIVIFHSLARVIEVSSQFFAPFLIFIAYTMSGGTLTASHVFPTLYLMTFLRTHLINFATQGVVFITKAQSLFEKILTFLDTPEVQGRNYLEPRDEENAIEFNDFEANWGKEEDPSAPNSATFALVRTNSTLPKMQNAQFVKSLFDISDQTLANITLTVPKNSKNVLIGPNGAGKSSLLLTLTGEISKASGQLRFSGKVAYVEQESTIFAGSLKDNILLDRKYFPDTYQKVLQACCLFNDYNKQSLDGNLSEIDYTCMFLSRSQKARIALARAVYSNADIYLLDDIFDGMDSDLADKVYEGVILDLLKDKTVILVTHSPKIIRISENIIVLKSGRIVGSGSYRELLRQGIDIEGIVSQNNDQKEAFIAKQKTPSPESSDNDLELSKGLSEKDVDNKFELPGEDQIQEEMGRVYNKEGPYTVRTGHKAFREYARACGSAIINLLILLLFILNGGLTIAFGGFLALWTQGDMKEKTVIIITGVLAIAALFMHFVKHLVFSFTSIKASSRLHRQALASIIRSPIGFFYKNSPEKIMSVFSEDMQILDQFLPIQVNEFISLTTICLLTLVFVAVIYPVLLIPIIIGIILITSVAEFCCQGIKKIREREFMLWSTISTLFAGTFSGLVMIRSYNQPRNFKAQFRNALDDCLATGISFLTGIQFMSLLVEHVYALIVIASLFALSAFTSKETEVLGLVLAFLLTLPGVIQSAIRTALHADILKSSVTRISSYEDLESEPPLISGNDGQCKSSNWPQMGKVEFKDITTKKTENIDCPSQSLSFQISPGEKVCCFGGPRSGKANITQALFRLVEIDRRNKSTGSSFIKIDGINIQDLGLHTLRDSIAIIPQIPVVFRGTLRRNLDPLDQWSDADLWRALQQVDLHKYVEKLNRQLNSEIPALSVLQKHLISFARALLKRAKIVIYDETNVDLYTSTILQKLILEHFEKSTVITITCRLSTVACSEKVLIMENGQNIEYESPYRLLVKEIGDDEITSRGGYFTSLVQGAGVRVSKYVIKVAKDKYSESTQRRKSLGSNTLKQFL